MSLAKTIAKQLFYVSLIVLIGQVKVGESSLGGHFQKVLANGLAWAGTTIKASAWYGKMTDLPIFSGILSKQEKPKAPATPPTAAVTPPAHVRPPAPAPAPLKQQERSARLEEETLRERAIANLQEHENLDESDQESLLRLLQ